MPIRVDLMKNEFLGPRIREVMTESKQKDKLEGELKGELTVIRRLLELRFGALPEWADERLQSRSTAELEQLTDRLLDAPSLEDLLK